jgi:hypothetical protein
MKRQKRRTIREKKYLVAIPIPDLDRTGRKLESMRTAEWLNRARKELTECFGGTTVIPAPGTNILDGEVVYEKGQRLVVSACRNRDDFLTKRDRIEAFAGRMAEELNQNAVFVLAFPSDSFLVEVTVWRDDK